MARRYSTSQGSEKENRPETEIRRYNMSYPDEGRKRSGHGAANPHAVLGITVALTKVNSNADSKYSSGSSPYLSSQIKMNPRVQTYRDGGDAPRSKIPSCSGLPVGWDEANDRCIAYLSTHAPLTRSGKIPANEATIERYSLQQISEFLMARFPKFRNLKKIPIWAIERRLQMLDLNENEYFRVPYGGYRYEEWGRDI